MHLSRLHSVFVLFAGLSVAGLSACANEDDSDGALGVAQSAYGHDDDDHWRRRDPCREHRRLLAEVLASHDYDDDDYDDHHHGYRGDRRGREDRDVRQGRKAFNDRKLKGLGGNGRACADCHQANDHYQLSPAMVQKRWDALQECRTRDRRADDPLFRAIDADDFRVNGQNASSFKNLKFGLVRVVMPLPPNIKLIDPATNLPSAETEVDLWRAVPTVNNVAITGPDGQAPIWPPVVPPTFIQRAADGSQHGPNLAGGYQIDARFGTLQEQANGALFAHAEIDRAPSQGRLDDLDAFQRTLFTPVTTSLSPLEEQGKTVFNRACGHCHGGAGMSTPIVQNPDIRRYQSITSPCPRPADSPTWCVAGGGTAPCPPRWNFKACPSTADVPGLQPRTYEITHPNGVKFRLTSSDPGRGLLTGYVGQVGGVAPNAIPPAVQDWQVFDNSPLHNLRNTAPYFHNNTAATLEEVLDHYDALFKRQAAVAPQSTILTTGPGMGHDRPFKPEERPALLAFLRTL